MMSLVALTSRLTALQADLKGLDSFTRSAKFQLLDHMMQERIREQRETTIRLASVMRRRIRAELDESQALAAIFDPVPHVKRMIDEADDLLGKLTRLDEFLGSAGGMALPEIDRFLLAEQAKWMSGYLDTLNQRIRRGMSTK